MKNSSAAIIVSPARLQEAFDCLRPELARMRKKGLLPVNVDPLAAASIIRAALPRFRTLRASIKKELPTFDLGLIDRLEQYSLALIHSHRQCICAKQPPERLHELIERVRRSREQLQFDVACLANRGLIKDYRRGALRVSTSHRNLASDVLTLSALFRKNWAAVSNRCAVTLEELDQAEVLANALISVLGERDRRPELVACAALERQKIYTLCYAAYDQVRRAVTLVRWEHGDANQLAPSLHGSRRARRKPKKTLVDAPHEQNVESSTSAVAATASVAATPSPASCDPFVS